MKILTRGTKLDFNATNGAENLVATVTEIVLNPNRKPGVGRVSYVLAFAFPRFPKSRIGSATYSHTALARIVEGGAPCSFPF